MCERIGGNFIYLSFRSPFASVTHLGAAPLNLKGKSSHFATTAPKGFLQLRFVLCPVSLFETPRLWIVEAALGISGRGCPGACCGGGLVLTQITRSVPTSLAEVTHYGVLRANFNQGGPQCTSLADVVLERTSAGDAPVYVAYRGCVGANFNWGCPGVRRLPRLCWRELQLGMPRCTSLAEVVLARTSTGDAPMYVAWKCLSWVEDVRGGLDNKEDGVLGDCAVEYAIRNMGCTHGKIAFVPHTTHGVSRVDDICFRESSRHHSGVACATVLGKARGAGSHEDSKCGAEAQKLSRSPMSGRSPKVGPKPDAVNAGPKPDTRSEPDVGPEPNAVNAGSEPDGGPKPESRAEAQCRIEAQ
ncbi:hypothetical protein CRG98_030367 [Punica granatum]|uniref:Uncharacterized protein n=1 Tax=Punica granatum TaxID=22663 RepID=A0A2I0IZ32_PUNGR|nr:hypothetical protein CRG98_030367 [Punica granatum]